MMMKIGEGYKHGIPRWVLNAEKRFRQKYNGNTYHRIPMNTHVLFKGNTYEYGVKYGDALSMGEAPETTFYRRRLGNPVSLAIWSLFK